MRRPPPAKAFGVGPFSHSLSMTSHIVDPLDGTAPARVSAGLSTICDADQIAVIDDGHVVEKGSSSGSNLSPGSSSRLW